MIYSGNKNLKMRKVHYSFDNENNSNFSFKNQVKN
ncbi:hypothetical protein B0I22_3022 [Epilithonimonas xixisoli]|uniref:Uncharacterized protein n=1 Tax=Epilithonimonas xixisoli TaxID=1476462 RepID=A0A4R8ID17_9FLAO|nr:hypothetical protein B0I22_3022 [Epilithonimonas xixisoli]